jgi:hypothetical protein
MEATEDRNVCTIEDAIETTERTSNEYENASERLGSDAKVLRPLGRNLILVKDRLEMIVEDEEFQERLDEITVGAEVTPLLDQLDRDLSAINMYLQNAASPLREVEVDGYAQAMGRYAEVFKVVMSRNKKYIRKKIRYYIELYRVDSPIAPRVHSLTKVFYIEPIATYGAR